MTTLLAPDSLRLTRTVIRLVRYLNHSMSETIGGDLGLTEIQVLGAIDKGATLASNIAKTLSLDPPRVTRLVERLVQDGLIERGSDLADRRRCPLSITTDGSHVLTRGREALSQAMDSVLKELPETGRTHLVEALDEVGLILDAHG